MRCVYELVHEHVVEIIPETGEKVCDTKLLGFFSSDEKCKDVINAYIDLPGFKDYPQNFVITEIEADVDDFNDVVGEFGTFVYYLAHEYYDGEYDHLTDLGYYSNRELAKKRLLQYKNEPDFIEYPENFTIDEYKIDKKHWTEGFSSW